VTNRDALSFTFQALVLSKGWSLEVKIDEFERDSELNIKVARNLDLLAIDLDDMEKVAEATVALITGFRVVQVVDLMCHCYYDLGWSNEPLLALLGLGVGTAFVAFNSWETAVVICAAANGFWIKRLLGTPCEVHSSAATLVT
jgi:hypothetical protein